MTSVCIKTKLAKQKLLSEIVVPVRNKVGGRFQKHSVISQAVPHMSCGLITKGWGTLWGESH